MKVSTHVFRSEQALHHAGAERVVALAAQAQHERGAFYLALSGGNTPLGLYQALAQPERAARMDWRRVHVFFGDERCVPPEHADSNYRAARECLFERVPLPADQIHRIHGERPPAKAAEDYARLVAATVPKEDQLPRFDLVLLGLGLDGHVASLFPDTEILHQRRPAAAPVFVPKLDAWRVSLTLPVINNARHVMLLVAGAKKADVVRHVLRGAPGATPLPVQMLRPAQLEWFLDAEAARYVGGESEA